MDGLAAPHTFSAKVRARQRGGDLLYPVVALASAGLVFAGLAWSGEREAKARFDLEARWEALATRPLEGRLAGLETYKPFRPTRPAPPPPALADLGGEYRGHRANEPASRVEEKRALTALLDGRGCPRAVTQLEAHTRTEAGALKWQAWSNLAAAQLACAPTEPEKAGPALESHLAAIEAATQALELEPTAPEAVFNRALGLERLPLPHQAREAWERYLEIDPSSEWAEEARRRSESLLHSASAHAGAGQLFESADSLSASSAEEMKSRACQASRQGRFVAALDLYAEAARLYASDDAWEKVAVVAVMRAEILDALARPKEALAEVATALPPAARITDPWTRFSTFWVAANSVAGRAPSAAHAMWSEAAEACREMPERPHCGTDARIRLARRLSDPTQAKAALEQAKRELAQVPATPDRDRTAFDLIVAEAEWLVKSASRQQDLEAAQELFRLAIHGFETFQSPASGAEARLARADLLAGLNRPEEAKGELEAGLTSLRHWDQDRRFEPNAAEAGIPGALRGIFERLITLNLESGGTEGIQKGFLLSEEMRDRLAPRLDHQFEPLREEALRRALTRLSPETAVVEYAVLTSAGPTTARRAVAWVVASSSIRLVELPLSDDLVMEIRAVRRAAETEDLERWRQSTSVLYRELMAPVIAELPSETTRLVLIPDAELHAVPFRGLWNQDSGRYLDEDFLVSLAPSVGSLRRHKSARSRKSEGPVRAVLSVGFEDFSGLGLQPLDAAEEEAAAISAIYGAEMTGCREIGSWASLRTCLPAAEVVHLATHAAADSSDSGRSWLAFPREAVGLDKLWRELPPLPRTRLVVLSACESTATASGGEGLGGLARPFLARGVAAVVGTLWPVDDGDAAMLFPMFHHEYRRTGEVATALRQSRARWASWKERPWAWAGVEVIEVGLNQSRKVVPRCLSHCAWYSTASAPSCRPRSRSSPTRAGNGRPSQSNQSLCFCRTSKARHSPVTSFRDEVSSASLIFPC